jgi:hypothetical protein
MRFGKSEGPASLVSRCGEACQDLERIDPPVSPKQLVCLAAAGSMFTIAHELSLIAGLTAVFTAILAVLAVLGDSTIALGMRAFRWVRHSVLLSCTPSCANKKPVLLERIAKRTRGDCSVRSMCASAFVFRCVPALQDALRALELLSPRRRQAPTGAIDEVLNHPDAGSHALR